ncbi:MAG: hypothetical protein ACK56I_25730, partial [bacterium]
ADLVAVPQLTARGGDGLSPEEVRPDDDAGLGREVADGERQPGPGERAVLTHVLEAPHWTAVDLPALRIARVPALPAPHQQAIRRVGDEGIAACSAQERLPVLPLCRVTLQTAACHVVA